MDFALQPAKKQATQLRTIIYGPDGAGKTYTALGIATRLATDPSKVILIDTEQAGEDVPRSGQYDHFGHQILAIPAYKLMANPDRAYTNFKEAIEFALKKEPEVLIIDSWSDEGMMYAVEKEATNDTYSSVIKPKRKRLETLLSNAPCHVIILCRSTEKAVWGENSKGKQVPLRMAEQMDCKGDAPYIVNLRFGVDNGPVLRTTKTSYPEIKMDSTYTVNTPEAIDNFVELLKTAMDSGLLTKERFKFELRQLGYPPKTWAKLAQDIEGFGEWSPERHEEMINLVKEYKDKQEAPDAEKAAPAKQEEEKASKKKAS